LLTHSCNYFSKEILEYRNRSGRVIIVYDEDETIAPQVTTNFIQKDVDNVFMLSGGMKVLYRKFPRGMLSGAVPKSCLPSPPPTARKGSGKQSTTPKPTQEEVVVRHRSHFTSEDLDAIQTSLDEALLASDTGPGSRASTQRSTTSVPMATSRSSTTSMRGGDGADKKPWR
jgi:centrosomal protein CEP41